MPVDPEMIRQLALWTALALLAGCGQKGPLYLPSAKDQPQPVAGTAATPAAPGERTSAVRAP